MEAIDYYFRGTEEYERQCYAEAVKYFELSNQIEEHFKTYEMLFCCRKELSDNVKAFACIEKAYQLNPGNDKTAFEYAGMLAASGDHGSARKVLADIIRRNPDYKKAAVLADSLKLNSDMTKEQEV